VAVWCQENLLKIRTGIHFLAKIRMLNIERLNTSEKETRMKFIRVLDFRTKSAPILRPFGKINEGVLDTNVLVSERPDPNKPICKHHFTSNIRRANTDFSFTNRYK
jgi:hypothetical protein